MSQQGQATDIVVNHVAIKQAVDWLLPAKRFAGMEVREGARWKPRMLAVCALLWVCSDLDTLTGRFLAARKIVGQIFRWHRSPGSSYQGFMKMLQKWHVTLQSAIIQELRLKMAENLSEAWRVAGYAVFAVDGSRVGASRTKRNEEALAPRKWRRQASKGKPCKKSKQGRKRRVRKTRQKSPSQETIEKKVNSPQIWLTLLWHVGSGLPWAWRTGPSDASERAHFDEMLPELPKNSLITADAGFVGYEHWKAILDHDHHYLIRVGSNVTLIKNLGYARQNDQTVYLWPKKMMRTQAPLVLRMICIHDGKQTAYLVTDLSKSQLSDRQAAMVYQKRWGIELFFRTFKQTFHRRKLMSRTPENLQLERERSLSAEYHICIVGQRQLLGNGLPL